VRKVLPKHHGYRNLSILVTGAGWLLAGQPPPTPDTRAPGILNNFTKRVNSINRTEDEDTFSPQILLKEREPFVDPIGTIFLEKFTVGLRRFQIASEFI
jgi:hypothetical protein